MDNTIFAQSVARIRFLETKLLGESKVQSLTEARDFQDCIRMLQDSSYVEYINSPSYEEGLKKALEDFYADMYKTSPMREVVDILAVKYDAHNIKALIKCKLSGNDASGMLINAGSIPSEKMEFMIKEENFRDMPKTLRPYIESALAVYKDKRDPQAIDISLDLGLYMYMKEIAESSKLAYLMDVVKIMIDIANIKSFIRIKLQDRGREFLKKVYIPGGQLDFDIYGNNLNDSIENFPGKVYHTDYYRWVKPGIDEFVKGNNLGAIEKYGDNYIIGRLWGAKLISFGPEPLVAYMLAKENEIRALRIILTGKKNNVHPDNIRERLRDLYV